MNIALIKMSLRGVLKGRRSNPLAIVRTPSDCFVAASRLLAMTLLLSSTANAQHLRIYACAIGNDSVGASMGGSSNGSGLYQSDDTGKTWNHLGWDNIKCYSMDEVQFSNGRILYEATGLGILRSTDYGEHWKQITDWRISEAMDVAVNKKNPNEIYIATAHGPWRTKDGGKKWELLLKGLSIPYSSRIVVDSGINGQILIASEGGIFKLISDSAWQKIPTKRYISQNLPEQDVTQFTTVVEVNSTFWVAGGADALLLISDDSAHSFHAWNTGPGTCWSITVVGKTKFNSKYLVGGPNGWYNVEIHNDVSGTNGPNKPPHVSGWMQPSIQSHRIDTEFKLPIRVISTLGEGVFGSDGHALDDRQIWTLKSFLVTP